MSDSLERVTLNAADDLLGRIASILDAARGQVVRAVNHATVLAYWHIGRVVSMFHPNLSWSHYRALMRVTDVDARRFYEAEAVR